MRVSNGNKNKLLLKLNNLSGPYNPDNPQQATLLRLYKVSVNVTGHQRIHVKII